MLIFELFLKDEQEGTCSAHLTRRMFRDPRQLWSEGSTAPCASMSFGALPVHIPAMHW